MSQLISLVLCSHTVVKTASTDTPPLQHCIYMCSTAGALVTLPAKPNTIQHSRGSLHSLYEGVPVIVTLAISVALQGHLSQLVLCSLVVRAPGVAHTHHPDSILSLKHLQCGQAPTEYGIISTRRAGSRVPTCGLDSCSQGLGQLMVC